MNTVLKLSYDFPPVPKKRARITRFGTYTPKECVRFEQLLRSATSFKLPFGFEVLDEAIGISVIFKFQKPKKMPKGRIYPSVRPDIDNYLKSVLDALNGVLWKDDGLIVVVVAKKIYSDEAGIDLSLWTDP